MADGEDTTGRVLVISGPGGVGKGTLVTELCRRHPDVAVSVSATTRPRRPGEVEGVHYHFRDPATFQRMIDADEFVEWAEFNGYRYGTPWTSIAGSVASGATVVLEIDVQGADQIRGRSVEVGDIDATMVFVVPPSWEELESRLAARGSESPTGIAARLRIGREEMTAADWFDYVVINDRLDAAVDEVARILAGLG